MKPQFFAILVILFFLYSNPGWSQNTLTAIEQDTTLAQKFLNRATDLANKAQYDSSNYYFEKAELIYEKIAIQYDKVKLWEKYVSHINIMGANLLEQGQYENAMKYLSKALNVGVNKLGENHIEIIKLYNQIGIVYYRKGKYDDAFNYYNKTLLITVQKLGENHPIVADAYSNIGNIYRQKGEYDKAIDYYNKSLFISHQSQDENNISIANIYNNIGLAYTRKGYYTKALEYYNRSLILRLQILGNNHSDVASSYINIGLAYDQKGDYDKALEYSFKSLPIKLQSLGENHPHVAIIYNNIGMIFGKRGDYDQALEYFNKSLSIRIEILGDDHPIIARSYNNIGNINRNKGDYDKALDYYKKSLVLSLQAQGDINPDLTIFYNNIGLTYYKKGDYNKALEYFYKSLSIRLQLMGENHPNVANNYLYIGNIYNEKGDYDKAFEYYNKSLMIKIHIWGENHPELADIYINIADLYYKQNNYKRALHYAQKSAMTLVPEFSDSSFYSNPLLKNIRSETNLLKTLEFKADILEKLYSSKSYNIKNIETAFATYQLVGELIDKIRSSYKTEGSKLFLGEKVTTIFDKAIRVSLKLYEITQNNEYIEQAFLFAEKSKSSVLFASLQDSKAKQFAGIPDSMLEQERELKIELAFYDTQIQKIFEKNEDQDSLKILEFEDKIFTLNSRYQKLIDQIERDYPKYYDLKYQTKSVSLSELQRSLDKRTALIEYFVGDSSIYIFTLTGIQLDVTEIEKDSSLHILTILLNKYIKQLDSKNFLATSYQLYNKLIHPIQHKLISKEKLIIIPHGFLYKIPFETLIAQPAKIENEIVYLINRFETTYHYSATLYMNGLKETKDQVKDESYAFSGFAPVFSDEEKNNEILLVNRSQLTDSTVRSFSVDGTRIDELRFSEQEVKAIIEMFKQHKQDAIGYFHINASEKNFKTIVSNYKYIHIASHSIINESKPKLSAIIFSQPTDKIDIEDGILYADEIYNLDLNADLVVLSSCESGIGKLVRGEGMMALTRGFLYAGASNIIVSLWKVHDRHTKELMVELYKNILTGKSYSCALREAKLKVLDKGPKVWSSFVLIGGE